MPTVILNQFQIFTEHSKPKMVTMRINTRILEAQGTRFIKKWKHRDIKTRIKWICSKSLHENALLHKTEKSNVWLLDLSKWTGEWLTVQISQGQVLYHRYSYLQNNPTTMFCKPWGKKTPAKPFSSRMWRIAFLASLLCSIFVLSKITWPWNLSSTWMAIPTLLPALLSMLLPFLRSGLFLVSSFLLERKKKGLIQSMGESRLRTPTI